MRAHFHDRQERRGIFFERLARRGSGASARDALEETPSFGAPNAERDIDAKRSRD
jgi:hypothetical protein